MDRKLGPAVDLKVDEGKGQVEAVFSTLKAIDKDGDVTLPGAFGDQKVRVSAFNHTSWMEELPVGKGTISEQGDTAVVKAQFFMGVGKARDTFMTVKELADLMEWSYGFDILEKSEGKWPEGDSNGQDVRFLKKLKVHEVSPVILGAGVDTRTLSAKNANKGAIPYSETGTTDVNWDSGLMTRRCSAAQAPLRALHAWVNSDGNPEAKSSYKFPHHMVSDNGAVGAANVRACVAAIAVLNGGRGGANIPDSDRQGVYTHVAHHVRDAGAEPPPLKSREEAIEAYTNGNVKLFDHVAWACAELEEVCVRIAEDVTQRAEQGQQLPEPVKDIIREVLANNERLHNALSIEPRNDPKQRQLTEQIFRDAQALLHLTRGAEFSES